MTACARRRRNQQLLVPAALLVLLLLSNNNQVGAFQTPPKSSFSSVVAEVNVKDSLVRRKVATTAEPAPTIGPRQAAVVDNDSENDNIGDAMMMTAEKDDDDAVTFPPPLSTVDRAKRAATFWSTALPIVASYYGILSQIKLQEILTGRPPSADDLDSLWNAQHQMGAEKLAATVTRLKGFYGTSFLLLSIPSKIGPRT